MMEVVTAVANTRSTTEREVVESYTYRQLAHIGQTYLKDRLLVLGEVAKALGSKRDGKKPAKKRGKRSLNVRRTPLRPGMRRDVHVIDIDQQLDGAKQAVLRHIMTPGAGPLNPAR